MEDLEEYVTPFGARLMRDVAEADLGHGSGASVAISRQTITVAPGEEVTADD